MVVSRYYLHIIFTAAKLNVMTIIGADIYNTYLMSSNNERAYLYDGKYLCVLEGIFNNSTSTLQTDIIGDYDLLGGGGGGYISKNLYEMGFQS